MNIYNARVALVEKVTSVATESQVLYVHRKAEAALLRHRRRGRHRYWLRSNCFRCGQPRYSCSAIRLLAWLLPFLYNFRYQACG